MRLTCPNCGAQYAVDAAIIPEEGRDVQCSSCGHTWFQFHPSMQVEAEEPPVEQTLPRREQDPKVMNILREEAARERAARAAERSPLESQPGLEMPESPKASGVGVDPGAGEEATPDLETTARRAAEAVPEISDAERARRAAPRRSLLPDIEEINSAIASDPEHGDDPAPIATAQRRAREARSARLGFGIAVGTFAAFTLLYSQGPRVAAAVPAFAPALEAYVGAVDRGRLWLDGALRAAVTPSDDDSQSTASEG